MGRGGARLEKLIEARLRSLSIGALAALNSLSLKLAGVRFSRLLVSDPLRGYRVVLEFTGGDRRQARLLLLRLLVGLVGGLEEVEKALDALEAGDAGPLMRLISRAARGGGGV